MTPSECPAANSDLMQCGADVQFGSFVLYNYLCTVGQVSASKPAQYKPSVVMGKFKDKIIGGGLTNYEIRNS